jgi:DNA-binding MarR family transcriptional regulator
VEIFRQKSATREDLGLLAVMEALGTREQISQRDIARETGLNLKKVNFCLHKLLEKGHVKFQKIRNNPDKRSYLYILTPSGIKAKSQLTYGFLKFSFDFYRRVEQMVLGSLRSMRASGVKNLLLYGASDVARVVIDVAPGQDLNVVGVIDPDLDSEQYYGVDLVGADGFLGEQWEGVLVTDLGNFDIVDARLAVLEIDPSRIWRIS